MNVYFWQYKCLGSYCVQFALSALLLLHDSVILFNLLLLTLEDGGKKIMSMTVPDQNWPKLNIIIFEIGKTNFNKTYLYSLEIKTCNRIMVFLQILRDRIPLRAQNTIAQDIYD